MRKSGNLWLAMIAALILVCVMAIAGCGKQQAGAGSGSEQSAQSALEYVLSCTVQEAADFETASEGIKQAAEETGDETGIVFCRWTGNLFSGEIRG